MSDLHIELEIDREARTLTVRDNGIGMTRDEVVELIGTIAKSGTAELLAKLRENADAVVSAGAHRPVRRRLLLRFMVADRVTLVTRRAGRRPGCAGSRPARAPTRSSPSPDAPQGTAVTLHLKPEDAEDSLHDYAVGGHGTPDRQAVLGLHHLADPDGRRAQRRRRRARRAGDAQLAQGAVGPSHADVTRRGVHRVLPARQPRLAGAAGDHPAAGRGHLRVPGAAVPARARRRSTCSCGSAAAACSSTCERVFIMDDCEAADPGVPALRQGRGRRGRPVAERVPRDPPAGPADPADPPPAGKKVLSTVKTHEAEEAEKLRHVLERVRPRGQGGPAGATRTTGTQILRDLLVRVHPRTPTEPTTLRPVRRADEGRPGAHLLPDRRVPGGDRELPAPGGVPGARATRCCCSPTRSTRSGSTRCPSSTARSSAPSPRASSTWTPDPRPTDAEREQRQQDFAGLLSWLSDRADRAGQGGPAVHPADHLAGLPGRRHPRHDARPWRRCTGRWARSCRTVKRILELNPSHPLVTGAARRARRAPGRRPAAPRRRSCCTAWPCSPRAASWPTRRVSWRCWPPGCSARSDPHTHGGRPARGTGRRVGVA